MCDAVYMTHGRIIRNSSNIRFLSSGIHEAEGWDVEGKCWSWLVIFQLDFFHWEKADSSKTKRFLEWVSFDEFLDLKQL